MGKCRTCGYKIDNPTEEILYETYGCARVKITKDQGTQIDMCSVNRVSGGYYAPGTDPDEIQTEDPEAFKENYLQMREQQNPKKNGNKQK